MTMRVWKLVEDGCVYHWVTAESEDAAMGCVLNQYGMDAPGELTAEPLPDDKLLKVSGDGDEPEERTCAEWARMAPGEYLACSEY